MLCRYANTYEVIWGANTSIGVLALILQEVRFGTIFGCIFTKLDINQLVGKCIHISGKPEIKVSNVRS